MMKFSEILFNEILKEFRQNIKSFGFFALLRMAKNWGFLLKFKLKFKTNFYFTKITTIHNRCEIKISRRFRANLAMVSLPKMYAKHRFYALCRLKFKYLQILNKILTKFQQKAKNV